MKKQNLSSAAADLKKTMKISNGKKQLAKIIHENGGWREGANLALFGKVSGLCYLLKADEWPEYETSIKGFYINARDVISKFTAAPFANWHQTILSREEYFHLYPTPDADGWIEWNGGAANPVEFGVLVDVKLANGEVLNRVSANSGAEWRHCCGDTNIIAYRLHKPEQAKPEFCESVIRSIPEPETKPTIEQLASDYRNAKDYADRKQEEADAAKADADAKLADLVAAGKALGLALSVADPEPGLVITDWRDLRVGDEVECAESNIERDKYNGMVGRLRTIDESDTSAPYLVDFGGEARIWCHEVKFIRRP